MHVISGVISLSLVCSVALFLYFLAMRPLCIHARVNLLLFIAWQTQTYCSLVYTLLQAVRLDYHLYTRDL